MSLFADQTGDSHVWSNRGHPRCSDRAAGLWMRNGAWDTRDQGGRRCRSRRGGGGNRRGGGQVDGEGCGDCLEDLGKSLFVLSL